MRVVACIENYAAVKKWVTHTYTDLHFLRYMRTHRYTQRKKSVSFKKAGTGRPLTWGLGFMSPLKDRDFTWSWKYGNSPTWTFQSRFQTCNLPVTSPSLYWLSYRGSHTEDYTYPYTHTQTQVSLKKFVIYLEIGNIDRHMHALVLIHIYWHSLEWSDNCCWEIKPSFGESCRLTVPLF